jgi:membrane-associated phospholipid phosphatase
MVIAGPLVGLGYLILKWIVGRRRPVIVAAPFDFHPFARGLGGLVHAESGLSFPSGHAALAFATATCLAAALPRWAPAFFLVACAVGAERVLENAHYLSDVVAGAGVGVLGGIVALALTRRLLPGVAAGRTTEPQSQHQAERSR